MAIRYLSGINVDSNTLFVDDANNRVGIGTASPNSALEISQLTPIVRINSSDNTQFHGIEFRNGGNLDAFIKQLPETGEFRISNGRGASWGGHITLYTDTVERLRITAAGNVGIGTTSPAYKLDVAGDINFTSTLKFGGVNVIHGTFADIYANIRVIRNASTSVSDGMYIGYDNSGGASGHLRFFANGTNERMRIDASSGNVGIGTTSPSALLNVAGNVTIGSPSVSTVNLYLTRTNGGVVADANYFVSGNNTPNQTWIEGGYYTGELAGVVTAPNSGYPYFEAYSGQGSATAKSFGFVNKTSGSFISTDFLYTMSLLRTGQIRFNQYGSGSFTGTVAYNLAVDSSGNIIETAGGVVDGSGTANYVSKWSDANTLTNSQLFDNGTDVGIGTASPFVKFDVRGEAMLLYRPAGNAYAIYSAANNTYSWQFGINNGSDFIITGGGFTGLGTERMRITSAGNVGIGTTSPASKLQIGSVGSTGYSVSNGLAFGDGTRAGALNVDANGTYLYSSTNLIFSPGTTEAVRITSAGNVGIGTTSPAQKLDVIGVGVFGTMTSSRGSYSNGLSLQNNTGEATSLFLWQSGVASAHIGSPANSTSLHIVNSYNTGLITDPNSIVLTNTGNVGIGTTSPAQKLHVVGNTTITGVTYTDIVQTYSGVSIDFRHQDASVVMRVDTANARVGIGTTSPSGKLSISTPNAYDGTILQLQSRDEPTVFNLKINEVVSAGVVRWSFDMTNGSAYNNVLVFDRGNVGIGTATPAQKLSLYSYSDTSSGVGTAIDITSDGPGGDVGYIGVNKGTGNGLVIGESQRDIIFQTGNSSPFNGTERMRITAAGNVGIGTTSPSQALHVTGNVRVTGAYYDSSNSAGSSGQVLSSTGSGTAWVNQGEATATSLFDLLPAARVTYAWSVQLTAGTWADIFSSNTVLSNGTWMVQAYVDDYAVGGQQYSETYSGVMSWGEASSTNQSGNQAISEIVLHRSGHAANSGNFYLRTVERAVSTLLFQGMSNQTYSAASTINFKFVKIF